MSDLIRNKRNHGIVIFENSIKALSNFLIPFAITLFPALKSGKPEGAIITFVFFIAFYGLGIIYSISEWIFKTYSIENGVFTVRHGVFVKKSREIPLSKINTIHEMQTLLQRLFSAWTIKLDTGSSLKKETEVKVVVSRNDLLRIRILLQPEAGDAQQLSVNSGEIPPEAVYRSKASDLIKMGLTSNAIFAGFALILSLSQLIPEFFNERLGIVLDRIEDYLVSTPTDQSLELIVFLIVVLLIYSGISLLIAALTSLIKYCGFKVYKEKDCLTIQYGLIRRNSFLINEDHIHAIYLKQSFFRQMFGYTSVHIESAGYGNEKGEEALLIPFVRSSEINGILTDILSGYQMPAPLKTLPKRSLKRFLLGSLFFPMILIIPVSIFYSYGFLSLILIPFFLISGFLQYRNSGVSHGKQLFYMGYGGFTKYTVQVKQHSIQAVIKKATPFQRAARLFTLNLSIHGTAFGKILAVKHLDEDMFQELKDLV